MPWISPILRRLTAIIEPAMKGDPGRDGIDGVGLKGDKGEPGKDGVGSKGDKGDKGDKGQDGAAPSQASINTLIATALTAYKALVVLPEVTIPASQLLTAVIGVKTFADRPCVGLKATDQLILIPKRQPNGYWVDSSTWVDGKVTVKEMCPPLTLGGVDLTFYALAARNL